MTSLSLSVINIRINRENASSMGQNFINKNPDFQREYEAWDDRLKTRFVETMLIGRAMNPIWTILNPDDGDSEEILDGMHRITTATDFLNGKFCLVGKHFTTEDFKSKYDGKIFKDLSADEKSKIRNYNFMFNHLDSSYRFDVKKRMDMYEILNRSSRTLNDYEFNKVLYSSFYDIIREFKNKFKVLAFIRKKDTRGEIDSEIISFLSLSSNLPNSWSSVTDLRNKFLSNELGHSEESVTDYLNKNTKDLKEKLTFIYKIVKRLNDEKLFDQEFTKNYILHKFFVCRLCFKMKNISNFNRHILTLIQEYKDQIVNQEIQIKLACSQRNSVFQKKLCKLLDDIIGKEFDIFDEKNKRLFKKDTILKKLKEQNDKCNLCSKDLNSNFEGDHIKEWSKKGKTEYENLQVLCLDCHRKK